MKTARWWAALGCVWCVAAGNALASDWHVATNGNTAAAGTNWVTAKLTIQAAVDLAVAGDTVWVSNGVYSGTGNRGITFRGKGIAVRGLHGPSNTVVDCQHNGRGFVFDSSETSASVLSGFTIQNGHAVNGGGISCSSRPTIEDCVIFSNQVLTTSGAPYSRSGAGIYVGGAGANPTIRNCRILYNDADRIAPVPGVSANGGGIAVMAGAAALIEACEVTGNRVMYGGGGIYIEGPGVTVRNCLIQGNESADWGGGVHCQNNSTTEVSRLVNCVIKGNTSLDVGGGVATYSGLVVENCTLYGNYGWRGGGIWAWPGARPQFLNSIVWSNTAGWAGPQFYGGDSNGVFSCCCSETETPWPGTGNIANDPRFVAAPAGDFHLGAGSPCIDSGNSGHVRETTDMDGNPRIRNGAVDMGAYEVQQGAFPELRIDPASTNLANGAESGRTLAVSANVPWMATTNVSWLAIASGASGTTNGTVVFGAFSNGLAAARTGAVIVAGGGISRTCTVIQAARIVFSSNWYVTTNGNDAAAGTNWATAKLTIQAAIEAATNGNTVWVSNGVYATGGVTNYPAGSILTNRVVINKAIAVRSVNGLGATVIRGAWDPSSTNGRGDAAVRCAYVANGGTLSGFTLTNGATRKIDSTLTETRGGGVCGLFSGNINDCLMVGNTANVGGGAFGGTLNRCRLTRNCAGSGGGSSDATLNHCLLTGNSASDGGGGTSGGTLNNCTVVGNAGLRFGGGVGYCRLYNCLVYSNAAPISPNWHLLYGINNSCTTPDPGGTNNITADPQFADAAAGDYRLRASSPCIDAGDNSYAVGTTDLDGNPRIINGTVDMGAYEVQEVFVPALWIYPTSTNLSSAAASGRTIAVTANVSWVATTNVSWLTIVSAGNGTVAFDAASNAMTSARTGAVIVAGGGLSRTCTVVQAAGTAVIAVTPASQSVGFAAGTTTVSVANTGGGTMVYDASASEPWLSIVAGGSGTNAGTITVSYDANTGEMARTGTVAVAALGAIGSPGFATVVQEASPDSLALSPANANRPRTAASGLTIGVAANVDWTAATTSSWISITGGSSGSGDGTVCYGVATNSGVARSGTITVSGGTIVRTFAVNQEPRADTILWEDFEPYAAGLWPSAHWFADANAADGANNRVIADPTRGGNRVLKMQGVVGGSWAALGCRSFAAPADFWVECKVWNGTETLPAGGHEMRGGLQLRQGDAWASYSRSLLFFHKSGRMYGGNGEAIGAYAAGTWQACKVHYVRSGNSVELSTWVNGQSPGTALISGVDEAAEASLSRMGLYAGAGTAYFDDIHIYRTPAFYAYYRDADGDGFGDPAHSTTGTDLPAGYVCDNTDWNDANASVHPGAPEVPDGVDNNGDWQIDEGARVAKTCFALNQSIQCEGSGWSRVYVLDLTNFQDIAAQDGYQNFTVDFLLYYNIWTGIYLYDYGAGDFDAVGWMVNLDL